MSTSEPTTVPTSVPAEVLAPRRTATSWSSPRGVDAESLPWRLWEKAKKLFWGPADIDYSLDRAQWAATPVEYQDAVLGAAARHRGGFAAQAVTRGL